MVVLDRLHHTCLGQHSERGNSMILFQCEHVWPDPGALHLLACVRAEHQRSQLLHDMTISLQIRVSLHLFTQARA